MDVAPPGEHARTGEFWGIDPGGEIGGGAIAHWWILLMGGAIWTPMLIAAYLHFRHPKKDPDACRVCKHEAGVNNSHCGHVDDNNGWSSSQCRCDNDWHWNYGSTAN